MPAFWLAGELRRCGYGQHPAARLQLSESRAELVPAMPSVSRLAHEFHSGAKLLKFRDTTKNVRLRVDVELVRS